MSEMTLKKFASLSPKSQRLWLDSDAHSSHCKAHIEGQVCCLEKLAYPEIATTSNSKKKEEPKIGKMQKLIDQALYASDPLHQNPADAIDALIEAVKLLARGQVQLMDDMSSSNRYRTDLPIGGEGG